MSTRKTCVLFNYKERHILVLLSKTELRIFCPDQDCYMYTKAMATFRENGCIHPVCPAHQRYAKLCVVKDKMKHSYGRPFFVCSERENPCKFWQWGDIFESPRPLCLHGMVCCERKVKKDGPNQNRLFYCCRETILVISSRGSNKSLVWSTLASYCLATHFNTDTKSKKQERHSIALRLTLEKP